MHSGGHSGVNVSRIQGCESQWSQSTVFRLLHGDLVWGYLNEV